MPTDESNEWIFNESSTTPGGRRTCQFTGPRGLSATLAALEGLS